MIGQCKACQYWGADWDRGRPGWGACRLTHTENDTADAPHSLAVGVEGHMEEAWLETRADFGCVQFAPEGGETQT